MISWVCDRNGRYSHAVRRDSPGALETACGNGQLAADTSVQKAVPDKCPRCVLYLLAPTCPCPAGKNVVRLGATLCECAELAEEPGLWASRLAEVAEQARGDLVRLQETQITALAQGWIDRLAGDSASPPNEDGLWQVRQWR